MSGFLPDIASWALRGGASSSPAASGGGDDDVNGDRPTANNISEDEVRAKRMARLAAFENKAKTTDASSSEIDGDGDGLGVRPMDVDDVGEVARSTVDSKPVSMDPSSPSSSSSQKRKMKSPPQPASLSSSSSSSSSAAAIDPLAKIRRRKAVLLRRVLLLTINNNDDDCGGPTPPSCVRLVLDDDFDGCDASVCPSGIIGRHVAELLTARLSLSPDSREISQSRSVGLISYLGGCHRRAGDEMRELRQQTSAGGVGGADGEMLEILEQIKVQVRRSFHGFFFTCRT
jgi:hypothetical protein